MDPYAVLGVMVGANDDAVRRAFRRQALGTHPDRNPHDPQAAMRFRRVVEAYQRLTSESGGTVHPRMPPAPYECGCCGDGFSYQAPCPRCETPTWPRGEAPQAIANPKVEALLKKLDHGRVSAAGGGFLSRFPEVLAGAYVGLGALMLWGGPVEAAFMLTAFGGLWMMLSINARLALMQLSLPDRGSGYPHGK